MDLPELIAKLQRSCEELVAVLQKFPEDQFNLKPVPSSWSAGDIAEHLVILDNFTSRIIRGGARDIKRDPLEKVGTIKETFEGNKKLTAGGPILPSEQQKDKEETIGKLKASYEEMVEILATKNPKMECLDFKHALFGYLTRAEWGYYTIFHTERHIHQIQNLNFS